jgi:hypothetical protein
MEEKVDKVEQKEIEIPEEVIYKIREIQLKTYILINAKAGTKPTAVS